MDSKLLSNMTLTKWIAVAVTAVVVAITLLFQFTSFQIPNRLTQGKPEPQVGGGINAQGSTITCNNLDEVYNKIHGLPPCEEAHGNAEEKNDE